MYSHKLCNNCGRSGHVFYQCRLPIISHGIIAFHHFPDGLKLLMIRRTHSFGYVDFIRGKYALNNLTHINNMFHQMSQEEKNNIATCSFDSLWLNMWGGWSHKGHYKTEEIGSRKKFNALVNGLFIGQTWVILQQLVNLDKHEWVETEWEFPKGRRDANEYELQCALREFHEETGISTDALTVVSNMYPLEELFIGSNFKSYKHKYFLARMEYPTDLSGFQKSEVSKMEWKTIDECLNCIRPYHAEKKQLVSAVNEIITRYRIC